MTIISRLKRALTCHGSAPKAEVVTFSRLDYWTMLALFHRIPLYDLVRLNGLASWWSGYVHKVCLTKRSISVYCGYKANRSIAGGDRKNKLKVVTISSTTSDRVGHLLPSITTLDLIIGGSQHFPLTAVTYLISQWSHQLVGLKLVFDSTFMPSINNEEGQFNSLLLSLNRITTLIRLIIRSESDQCRLKEPIDLPILSQLVHFYFGTGEDDFANLRDLLVKYAGPNVALKYIELCTFQWFDHMHDDLEFLEQPLLSKFTKMCIVDATLNEWALFPNLRTVGHQLQLNSRSRFIELISEMQFSKVHFLSLTLCISTGFDRNSGQVLANAPPLQSITKLELQVVVSAKHVNLYSAFKSLRVNLKMFPNVQAVQLNYYYLRSKSGPLADFFSMLWRKISMPISYRMLKRRVQRDFPGVDCSFKQFACDGQN